MCHDLYGICVGDDEGDIIMVVMAMMFVMMLVVINCIDDIDYNGNGNGNGKSDDDHGDQFFTLPLC